MKDNVTISTFQLFETFPNQESARKYLESRLWPHGVKCPACKGSDRITVRKGGYYRCNPCHLDFTVRTGTVFGRSHVPLHKWLYAMYLLVTSRKGVSSLQLSKEIGITQKTAWFLLHRLREACGDDLTKLRGFVEIDETYIGGKEHNKHQHKKFHSGTGWVGKTAVLGMRQRGGGIRTKVVAGTSIAEIQPAVKSAVAQGSTICTDEHSAYVGMDQFRHLAVNHSNEEFVRGEAHTNGIESVWAVLKRGLYGVYHHASKPHLHRYVNEFAFRLDNGNVRRHTMSRLDSMVAGAKGRRLTYRQLTGKPDSE